MTLRDGDTAVVRPADGIPAPAHLRRRVDRLLWERERLLRDAANTDRRLQEVRRYLGISDRVTAALEALGEQLFRQLLRTVEEKLTIALQEILEQPIRFRAEAEFKRGAAAVEFRIERDGHAEDILKGQGGSVANVLSVGLRMFALTALDPAGHRRFLVLDEQDCWLRPDLVPKLVKIVHDAGRALGFQVLLISHHDLNAFERYADKIYRFVPGPDGAVTVRELRAAPAEPDGGDGPGTVAS